MNHPASGQSPATAGAKTLSAGLLFRGALCTTDALEERAARAASLLHDLGVRQGGTVAILQRNSAAFIEASLGAQRLGAVAVPINWHFAPAEVGYVLQDCGARVLVGDSDLLDAVVAVIPPTVTVVPIGTGGTSARRVGWEEMLDKAQPSEPESPTRTESMIYTSGTTGRPKGVRRTPATERQASEVAATRKRIYGHEAGMRALLAAPLYHSAPNYFALNTLRIGGTLVLEEKFDAEETLRLIETLGITHVFMVPTMFVRLLALPDHVKDAFDPSSLRWVLHAGAPCPPNIKSRMMDWWGPVLTEYYGSTELGPITFCDAHEWLAHPGTVGRALDGVEFSIRDEAGAIRAAGEAGEVIVSRTPQADFSYHGDDEKRQGMQTTEGVASGDIGFVDEDGYLFLCDRRTDMVISGGVNIYPAEIEAALMDLAGIADCAVFGLPDEEYGERLVAFIQLEPSMWPSTATISAGLRERIAGYKVPREFHFVGSLPRDDSGKIFKRRLREQMLATPAHKSGRCCQSNVAGADGR